jgi:hypothetical protein
MNWAEIQQAIYTWANGSTDCATAWADQKRPQDDINSAMVTLRPMSVIDEGEAEVRERETSGELYQDSFLSHLLTVNVQVATKSSAFASHAMNIAQRARNSLRLLDFSAGLDAAGLSVVQAGAVSNISAVAGPGFESRATFDVVFRVMSVTEAETSSGWFNQVQITGNGVVGDWIGPPEEAP